MFAALPLHSCALGSEKDREEEEISLYEMWKVLSGINIKQNNNLIKRKSRIRSQWK
jgi:hypothetical protein